jgi:hypothetical protein
MIRSITFVVECCLVLVLRKGEWNKLTGHSKHHGNDSPNSRANSLQPGEDDVDRDAIRTCLHSFRTAYLTFQYFI